MSFRPAGSARGPRGFPGTDGTDGVDGVDGVDGADGINGVNAIPADEFIGERLADDTSAAYAAAAAGFALDPKVSLVGATAQGRGDSWMNGFGITPFASVAYAAAGVTTYQNCAVAGMTTADVAAVMLKRGDATYSWVEGMADAVGVHAGLNNGRFVDMSLDANAKWLRAMENDYRLICAILRGKDPVPHDDASFTYTGSGTWTTYAYTYGATSTIRGTTTQGAAFAIDVTGMEEIAPIIGGFYTEDTGVVDWILDGVTIRTTELNNDVQYPTAVGSTLTVVATPERFTGLPPDAKVLTAVKRDATSAAVYCIGYVTPSDNPPPVELFKAPTLPEDVYAMYPPFDQGTDESIYAMQDANDVVAEEFTGVSAHQLPVLTPVVDFQVDFIHPDPSGRDKLAADAEEAFDPQVLNDRVLDILASDAAKRALGALDRRNQYGTISPDAVEGFDEAVVDVVRVFFEETTTAAATAAKTLTTTWTPTLGDKLYLSLDLGNTIGSPTLNINGGGAKAIWLGGNPVLADAAGTGANGVWELIYDGTRWHMLGSVLNFAVAPIASPAFTGNPTAPTPTAGDNDTSVATTAFVKAAIDAVIAAAPGALDTLDELAAALGDDANFASTITTALAGKQPLIVAATTATAAGTAAKAATIGSYVPVNGSLLVLRLTNGNSAAAPTINIDGGGAKNIWAMGFALTAETAVAIADTEWLLRYDGTQWHLLNSPNYTLPSQAIAEAGSSVAGYYWSPQRVKQAIDALSNPTSTTAALAAIGNAVNTTGKYVGKQYFNTTTGKPVWAVGATAASVWVDATGATVHTPV